MYEIVIGRNEAERQKLGLAGSVLLGKHYVRMGETESLSNLVYLDVNHSHVVFICGKRGSGKCLTGETLIPLADGSVKRIDTLKSEESNVFGLDEHLRVQPLAKEGFYERTVQRTLTLTLRSGKNINLTPEHPLLTIRGWVSAENLTINDRIATPRVIPHHGSKPLPEHAVKLLAYLIAEGHVKRNIIRFTNFDERILADFRVAAMSFENIRIAEYRRGQLGIASRELRRRDRITHRDELGRIRSSEHKRETTSVAQWLESLGLAGKKAGEKRIPDCVYTLPKEQLALFLNRLFSCDGTIYRKKGKTPYWQVSYASKSRALISQVQHLLLHFGALSSIREKQTRAGGKYFTSYELTVLDTDKFIHEIGFFGEKALRAEAATLENLKRQKNPNIDTVPRELWDFYRPKSWAAAGRTMNYAYPKALRESMRYAPSRQKLLQIARADERTDMELLAQADIYWDFITGIEEKKGEFPVYDITVPQAHNFIANDIIVHNSYTMGGIAEGMATMPEELRKKLAVVILDTMGIFWTMRYPNKKDKSLLLDWGLQGNGLNVEIFTPAGYYQSYRDKGIPTDHSFSLLASELTAADWCMAFGISLVEPLGALIEKVLYELKEEKENYTLDDILGKLEKSADSQSLAGQNRFQNAKYWGLFSDKGTPLSELIRPGQISVLDVSCYAGTGGSWNIRSLVIGLVAQKLFLQRMGIRKDEEYADLQREVLFTRPADIQHEPLVWLMIDEAHEFLPREGKTPASDALITILREGRQPGISLVLATQQPGKIHTDVMTQADVIVSHRITAKLDTDALAMLTQSYMRGDLDRFLNELPRVKGAAVVLDDNNEKVFPIRVRPRQTWHGGSDPELLSKQ